MPIVQQGNVFIDPESCGSSVGYHLLIDSNVYKDKVTHSVNGTVVLADCSHKIDWNFCFSKGQGDSNLGKIDAAIHMLQEFRKKYAEAEKMVTKLNK